MTLKEILDANRHESAVQKFARQYFLRGALVASAAWVLVVLLLLVVR